MRPSFAIHGSYLGGYGLPGLLVFVTVFAGLASFFSRIWIRPSSLIAGLILYGFFVGTAFVVEAISRRNVVEVSDDRIRWSFRQPPEQGDQPLSALKAVEVNPSGARLVFEGRFVLANTFLFRRRDITRLVSRLQEVGAPVSDQPAIH